MAAATVLYNHLLENLESTPGGANLQHHDYTHVVVTKQMTAQLGLKIVLTDSQGEVHGFL